MKSEHNIILEKSEAQDLIIDQAIENSQQYSLYHYNKTLTQKESPEQYRFIHVRVDWLLQ